MAADPSLQAQVEGVSPVEACARGAFKCCSVVKEQPVQINGGADKPAAQGRMKVVALQVTVSTNEKKQDLRAATPQRQRRGDVIAQKCERLRDRLSAGLRACSGHQSVSVPRSDESVRRLQHRPCCTRRGRGCGRPVPKLATAAVQRRAQHP